MSCRRQLCRQGPSACLCTRATVDGVGASNLGGWVGANSAPAPLASQGGPPCLRSRKTRKKFSSSSELLSFNRLASCPSAMLRGTPGRSLPGFVPFRVDCWGHGAAKVLRQRGYAATWTSKPRPLVLGQSLACGLAPVGR